jgi:hypothetical protein
MADAHLQLHLECQLSISVVNPCCCCQGIATPLKSYLWVLTALLLGLSEYHNPNSYSRGTRKTCACNPDAHDPVHLCQLTNTRLCRIAPVRPCRNGCVAKASLQWDWHHLAVATPYISNPASKPQALLHHCYLCLGSLRFAEWSRTCMWYILDFFHPAPSA